MKISLVGIALLSLVSVTSAQSTPPALMIQVEGKSQPLGLTKLEVDARLLGHVAETTLTMTFFNPLDRVMEGNLYFPLPEGATVSGYALDIDGQMVDGVAVTKDKGRKVFEQIVRRGIDPGLVEWTRGNHFQTRVFPLPARATRTIRLSYVSELVDRDGREAFYLPLNFAKKIANFSIRIEVVKPRQAPRIESGGPAGLTFGRWENSFVAKTEAKDILLDEDLIIRIPEVRQQTVLVEETEQGDVYFAVIDTPPILEPGPPPAPPRHVAIYWDASSSRAGSDHADELRLLNDWLGQWKTTSIEIDLILLRNEASQPKRFTITGGNASVLLETLRRVDYDGGTQMSAIERPNGSPDIDLILLFSDGISTFGRSQPDRLEVPVYAISAEAGTDHAFLRHLAMTSGGRYFNLSRISTEQAMAEIGSRAFSFLGAESDASAVDLFPQLPQPVVGRCLSVGRLQGDAATVVLKYGLPGDTPQKRSFDIRRRDAAKGTLLERLWAQTQLSDLMVFQKRNEEQITALGKQFGLVTPFTSLIVLDSLEQYVEHEILPPASLPKMREAYAKQLDTLEHQKRKQQNDKLEILLAMWQQRVAWWEKKYTYPPNFKYRASKRDKGADTEEAMEDGAEADPFGVTPEAAPEAAPDDARDPFADPETAPAPITERGEAIEEVLDAEEDAEPRRLLRRFGSNAGGSAAMGGRGKEKSGDKAGSNDSMRQPGIVIKEWDPKTPYLAELKAAAEKDVWNVYLKNRAQFGTSPAFFLDCANFFFQRKETPRAIQVLSNVAELELEDAALLRVVGHRLTQAGSLDLAVLTFEEVLKLRPEEPQSFRDLALVLVRRAEKAAKKSETARTDYQRAVELLHQTVMGRWDNRFERIEVIALEELNHLIPKAKASGVQEIPLDKRLIRLLDVDVRIVMTWHADMTDIDLWVIEPSSEKAFYSHNRTTIGGLVSDDFTGGYGPEEYMVRRAMPGVYSIHANYYGSRAVRLLGAVTVQVDVFTNYGRANEVRRSMTLRLEKKKETVPIGQIEY